MIHVPTSCGHLRFWWRALHGHRHRTAEELCKAETAVWGRLEFRELSAARNKREFEYGLAAKLLSRQNMLPHCDKTKEIIAGTLGETGSIDAELRPFEFPRLPPSAAQP